VTANSSTPGAWEQVREALVRVAREVASGRADLSEHEPAWRRLRTIPNIGNWTLEMLAVAGQGRDDKLPALDVAYRRLMRQKDPPRIVSFEIGLQGMNYDLGDVVQLTHYQGVGASGWAGQPMRIIRHEADPNNFSVALDCFDMQALFSGAFILGDETALPAAWTSASLAEQQYGYLCDETTGKFSDGKPGKRLR